MDNISSSIESAYKNSNLYLDISKERFPFRWKVSIYDEPFFFFLEKKFILKRNAIKYSLEVADEFTNRFW